MEQGPDDHQWDELVTHLARSSPLDPGGARRVIEEVVAYCREAAPEFVRRRHRELQAEGVANPASFARIAEELRSRPVAAPDLSERQIRRLIYH